MNNSWRIVLLVNLRHDILHLLGTSGCTSPATGPIPEPHHMSLHPHMFLLSFISVLFPVWVNMVYILSIGYVVHLALPLHVGFLFALNLADTVTKLHSRCCRQVVCPQSVLSLSGSATGALYVSAQYMC